MEEEKSLFNEVTTYGGNIFIDNQRIMITRMQFLSEKKRDTDLIIHVAAGNDSEAERSYQLNFAHIDMRYNGFERPILQKNLEDLELIFQLQFVQNQLEKLDPTKLALWNETLEIAANQQRAEIGSPTHLALRPKQHAA